LKIGILNYLRSSAFIRVYLQLKIAKELYFNSYSSRWPHSPTLEPAARIAEHPYAVCEVQLQLLAPSQTKILIIEHDTERAIPIATITSTNIKY
jgi:hypothetical protein